MPPQGKLPLSFICLIGLILFSVLSFPAFLGLAINDIWSTSKYSRGLKIILSICLAFFPEIGVLSWVVYFGKTRKLILRIIALVSSGVYLLWQIDPIIVRSSQENSVGAMLISGFMVHARWLPFALIGGTVSFFILRAIFNKSNVSTPPPEIPPESH